MPVTNEGGGGVGGEPPARRAPAFYPVLIEVAGGMEDECVREVTQRLRKYRNRYTPLLRCMFTLVATAVPEARLFGDSVTCIAEEKGTSRDRVDGVAKPLFTSPRYAVSVNKTYPLLRRFYPSTTPADGNSSSSDQLHLISRSPTAAVGVSSLDLSPERPSSGAVESPTSTLSLPWVDSGVCPGRSDASAATTVACRERAVHQLEEFMSYHFLPFAMTHNVSSSSPLASSSSSSLMSAERTFILRHYINEASRTSSFLFADPYHTPCEEAHGIPASALQAVLVDPREEQREAYLADIAALGATLTCVIFTHFYVDGSAGLPALVAKFPAARVVSGLPLTPPGTTCSIPISSHLSLRTVAVPAFSPECLLVEVRAGGALVGLCTGVLWSPDAAPRWDLLQWVPYPSPPPRPPFAKRFPAPLNSLKNEEAEEEGKGDSKRVEMCYGGGDRDAALAHSHRVLKELFFEPYLAPICRLSSRAAGARAPPGKSARTEDDDASAEEREPAEAQPEETELKDSHCADALQRVVLLPTHGGYSNVTSQLDLYWAAYLGDLCRMKHSRIVIDTLATDAAAFVTYNKRLPRLPHPPLFDASRVLHLRQLVELMPDEQRANCISRLPADMQRALTNSFDPYAASSTSSPHGGTQAGTALTFARALTSYVNVVDVRDAKEYHALHLSGSVNVPMSFPGVAYGARRAELWLQCVLVPHQPILVLCAAASHKAEVRQRLSALSPGCTIAVFTLEDLPHLTKAIHDAASVSTTPRDSAAPWREIRCERPAGLPAELPIPAELVWVQHTAALPRLTSYEHLVAIEPTDTRVVLDVRTPYEFKNGSHQHSVHIELSEMCNLAVEDAMSRRVPVPCGSTLEAPQVPSWFVGSSPQLADIYMEKMHTTALMAGLPIVRQETALSDVVIYCAGGYRSLIAASLLQRAMETSANPAWRTLHVADVSGGAFQIMTQRPDLWRVKDRSIICIS